MYTTFIVRHPSSISSFFCIFWQQTPGIVVMGVMTQLQSARQWGPSVADNYPPHSDGTLAQGRALCTAASPGGHTLDYLCHRQSAGGRTTTVKTYPDGASCMVLGYLLYSGETFVGENFRELLKSKSLRIQILWIAETQLKTENAPQLSLIVELIIDRLCSVLIAQLLKLMSVWVLSQEQALTTPKYRLDLQKVKK